MSRPVMVTLPYGDGTPSLHEPIDQRWITTVSGLMRLLEQSPGERRPESAGLREFARDVLFKRGNSMGDRSAELRFQLDELLKTLFCNKSITLALGERKGAGDKWASVVLHEEGKASCGAVLSSAEPFAELFEVQSSAKRPMEREKEPPSKRQQQQPVADDTPSTLRIAPTPAPAPAPAPASQHIEHPSAKLFRNRGFY